MTIRKLIEIGPTPYIWQAFPEQTEFYSTWTDETRTDPASNIHVASIKTLFRLLKAMVDPSVDLIVAHSFSFAPWDIRSIARLLFRRGTLARGLPISRTLAQQVLRMPIKAPLAVIDFEDYATISRANMFMLKRATAYFKRELPPDRWRLFAGVLHRTTLTPRFRTNRQLARRLAKVQPLSLGLPLHARIPSFLSREKQTDVFFAGRVNGSSTVRERGFGELLALRNQGYAIDIPDERLEQKEFFARCARAWLVWSPEGYGWQCFREFEALMCGSVPVCNQPTIERANPLVHGVHSLYYAVETGGLTTCIKDALCNRDRLRAIANAGRAHILKYHTPDAIARGIVEKTLELHSRR
jgi:Glycosyl transferases group 1